VLADYFGVPARVHECMGQWVMLPGDCCCRLGQSPATGLLGRTLVVGRHMWDCQMKFRVSLGPMRFRDFQRFLPGAHSLHRLHDWIEFYTSKELEWEAQLILRKEDVPGLLLGRSGRLGWTTWIGSQAHCRDADEVVLASTVAA
jgi:type VI secretion system protein ImpH